MKNWRNKTVTTVLALSLLIPGAAFAANEVIGAGDGTGNKGTYHLLFLGEKNHDMKSNLIELVEKYSPESLEDWNNTLAEKEQLLAKIKETSPVAKERPVLSEEVKEKMQEIREGVKNGSITPEKAQEELKALGIENFRGKGMKQLKGFAGSELSDEEKEKMQAIHDGVKNGTITAEEAKEELKALGIKKFQGMPELSDVSILKLNQPVFSN